MSGDAVVLEELASLLVDVDSLTPLPGNPRVGDVEAIARSLKQFGQRKPIVTTLDGTVIAGNHTLLAARSLGWPRIAAVHVNDDEVTAKAFALADNRTGDLGSYDDEALVELLAAVHDADASLFAATGYNADDLAKLIASPDFDGSPDEMLGSVSYSILVECDSERQQASLLERLETEGFTCRPIAS